MGIPNGEATGSFHGESPMGDTPWGIPMVDPPWGSPMGDSQWMTPHGGSHMGIPHGEAPMASQIGLHFFCGELH